MTRNDYLRELKRYLKKLPADDYQEAMDYFTEYFDEAGPENETQVIQDLGSPKEAANDILNTILDEKTTQLEQSPKNHAKILWIAALVILASPIAFPLAITLLALLVTLAVLLFTAILSAFIFAFAGLASAATLIWDSFSYMGSSLPAGLMGVGGGIALLGLALLITFIAIQVSHLLGLAMVKFVNWIIKKGKRA